MEIKLTRKQFIYRKYRTECDKAYPATFELGEEDKMTSLRPIVVPGLTIPVPLYHAGFPVSRQYIFKRQLREDDKIEDFQGIVNQATDRWLAQGKPRPFYSARLCFLPTCDYLITFASSLSAPSDLEMFVKHPHEILDRYLGLMKFTEEEKEFIKTRGLFKWYRDLCTGEEESPLPEDACLRTGSLNPDDRDEYD
ncbi:hypothetical protein CC2G_001869 [Coprinopsis cinerea AmutBmut pab1-1]|nr:hypothetical protein CC2G_001869 [Coprinopsis cinerea AmutBmut pab1-1]